MTSGGSKKNFQWTSCLYRIQINVSRETLFMWC